MFTEKSTAYKGHIIVQLIDKDGNVLDKYEEHNLIMDNARVNMAQAMGGVNTSSYINKIVLGTEGHVGDILTPKTATEGFVSSRTETFAEELSSYFYEIDFTLAGAPDEDGTVTFETDSGSTVHRTYVGSDITYSFIIPDTAANDAGTVAYTEAALYAGDKIFSMKTFPGKVKDNTVGLQIIWKILF